MQNINSFVDFLVWLLDRIVSGVILGALGFISALLIYRVINYHVIDRGAIRDQISLFLKKCNGDKEQGVTHHLPTKDDPEGHKAMNITFPNVEAITHNVRANLELYKFNRWGFKYDKELISSILEDMLMEGCVGAVYDPKTAEVVGWSYSGMCNRRVKLSLFRSGKVRVEDDGMRKDLIITHRKRKIKVKIDEIERTAIEKTKLGILTSSRIIEFNCGFKWRARKMKRVVDRVARL